MVTQTTNDLLISSPGSGLYVLHSHSHKLDKLLTADCRGIARSSHGFFVATTANEILEFDSQFRIARRLTIEADSDVHGLRLSADQRMLYAAETARDVIGVYELDPFNRVDEIRISSARCDRHHVNDLWLQDGSLLVSMFSLDHHWREEPFSGVIAEYDLTTNLIKKVRLQNLGMPHSVMAVNGDLYFCDSLSLCLKRNEQVAAGFNGFTRGLAFDGRTFYVGQSEPRTLEYGLRRNPSVSLDCGIHLFDHVMRTTRFIQIDVGEIYEIAVLSECSE